MKEFELIGIVEIRKNGKLIERGQNSIQNGLKSYFESILTDASVNKAIDNHFTDYGEQFGGTQDNLDGIVLEADNVIVTTTTSLIGGDVDSAQWQGEWTNESGGDVVISEIGIGHNLNSTGTTNSAAVFDTAYARYVLSSAITANDLDSLVIDWTIHVAFA